jgi:hypothetical protein
MLPPTVDTKEVGWIRRRLRREDGAEARLMMALDGGWTGNCSFFLRFIPSVVVSLFVCLFVYVSGLGRNITSSTENAYLAAGGITAM